MADRSVAAHSEAVKRRTLLKCAVGAAGGAAASMAQLSSGASALSQLEAVADTQSGGRLRSPNYRPPVVEIQAGKLRGFRDGRTITFLGIPYTEADRFELPKPVRPWVGIKSAQAWGPVCPIPNDMSAPGGDEFVFPHRYWLQNEHCQVLNVWTQSTSRTARKPVMVWFHGGGFVNGSSMEAYAYTGKNLSEYGDVVVVSMNHRLNVIGALDLSAYGPEYANSRYTGTADMVAALQWVHDNIETFGGDASNVTLFGQSAGGAEVVRMLHTPGAKGLFHKVIAESGGTGESPTDPAEAIHIQQMIAAATLENLNLRGDQIDQLKAISYPKLLAAGADALTTVAKKLGKQGFGWDQIPDDRYILRKFCDWASSIPLMGGNTFSEFGGTLDKGTGKNEWTEREIDARLSEAFGDRKNEIVGEFRKVFPRKKVQDVLYYSAKSRVPFKALLARKLGVSEAPAFSYIFAYEYPVNGGITAFHCSEIAFVFHNLTVPELQIATGGAPAGFALQDKVSQAWINFARIGNPSQRALEWKPFTAADPQTMVFDVVSECRALPDEKLNSLISGGHVATLG